MENEDKTNQQEINQNFEKSIEKRKEKIIHWFKNPYNSLLVAILLFGFIIRLYYYYLTKGQAVWWDSAEYMNMARAWALGLDYEFLPVRPVLFSIITALFFKISPAEFLPRVFIFLISMSSVWAMYLLGKEVCNKKIGLITAFFMSVFYLNLFYSFRLLVEIPSITFFTFAAFFFYRYFKTNSKKDFYWGSVMIAIGTLFRINTAALLFVILIFLILTTKLGFIKRKEMWIGGIIFLLILAPYLIWGYIQFNGFVITQAGAWNAPKDGFFANGFENLQSYRSFFLNNVNNQWHLNFLSWPLLIFFILGLVLMCDLFLGFDILLKGKNIKLKRNLFLFLAFLVPILVSSFSIGFVEDRYMFVSFPAIFIISSIFILKTYDFIKKQNKFLAILFLIVLLGFIGYSQLQHADLLIKSKQQSYMGLKDAGLWLKENSQPSDIIVTRSVHQIRYYAERETISIPYKGQDLDSLLSSDANIKFLLLSIFESHESWEYAYPQENNLTVVNAIFADANQQQPILIIYRIDRASGKKIETEITSSSSNPFLLE